MTRMEKFISLMKDKGYKIKKQRGLNIWQIYKVGDLDAITLGNKMFTGEWRLGLYQEKKGFHLAFREMEDLFKIVEVLEKEGCYYCRLK